MYALPTIEEIRELASSMGVPLDAEEARRYQAILGAKLDELDEFVQSRIEEERPPLLFAAREPGYRPGPAEDPYRAWMWRCRIGGGDGMLAGRSVSFKDHVSVAGIPQTFGLYAMEGYRPDFDATIVTRVLAAGAVVTGKNAMSGFGGTKSSGSGSTVSDYGRSVNPHDPGHLTGGSSSGSAAAVAAGEVDVSFGGDQGGSIRVPAAYCGVIGLKPTFGLISHMGVTFGAEQSLDFVGPMARHTEEVARALEAVAGYDGYDPRQGREVPERLDVCSGLDAGVAGLRIGLLSEGFEEPIDPQVRAGVLEAVALLGKAGAEIVEVSLPMHRDVGRLLGHLTFEGSKALRDIGPTGAWARTYYPTSLITTLNRLWDDHLERFQPRTVLNHMIAEFSRRNFHGAVYAKAHNARPVAVRAYDSLLSGVDLLAMPTCPTVAPPVPASTERVDALGADLSLGWSGAAHAVNTRPFNYTGHPALALPCGKVDGLPISLQLVGRSFEDSLVLRAARAYEQLVDWEALIAVGR